MTTFVKSTWTIPYMNGARISQSGYASKNFGIHKQKAIGEWCVTHIPSGLALDAFRSKSLRTVKNIVARAEERFDWSVGLDVRDLATRNHTDARSFYDEVKAIASQIKSE